LPTDFVHLVKLKTMYGDEPKNAGMTLERIRREEVTLHLDRIDIQRATELPWAIPLVTTPDFICPNWKPAGKGDEAYVKNFGTKESPIYRVMICRTQGRARRVVTIFPREKIAETIRGTLIWP
jgi:hypothetical protein